MLSFRWTAALISNRSLQLLPLALIAAVFGAIQVKLLTRPLPMDIPSTLGTPPGAAPQQSVAPLEAIAIAAPSAALPSESLPPQSLPTADQPSSVAMATRSEPSLWTDHLPRVGGREAGVGNLRTKAKQPTVITTMIGALLQSLKRFEPGASTHLKAVISHPLKPAVPQIHATLAPIIAPRPGWTLGGAAPRPAVLGGPRPLATRYAPSINGAAMGHQ